VNKDNIRLLAGERFKSGVHRSLPGRSAVCGRLVMQVAYRAIEHCRVIGIDDRLDHENLWMPAKWFHGPEDHALAGDGPVLFGPPNAGAEASSGCDDDGCSPIHFSHGGSKVNWREKRSVGTALITPRWGKQSDSHEIWEIAQIAAVHLQDSNGLSKV
jgi:hypothetical protein